MTVVVSARAGGKSCFAVAVTAAALLLVVSMLSFAVTMLLVMRDAAVFVFSVLFFVTVTFMLAHI